MRPAAALPTVLLAVGLAVTACGSSSSSGSSTAPTAAGATAAAASGTPFTSTQLDPFRAVAQDTLTFVKGGQQAQAVTRVKDLETSWDSAATALQRQNASRWTVLDKDIDAVLAAVRASSPDATKEQAVLTTLLTDLKQ